MSSTDAILSAVEQVRQQVEKDETIGRAGREGAKIVGAVLLYVDEDGFPNGVGISIAGREAEMLSLRDWAVREGVKIIGR